jgi:hypothetical protein
MLRIKASSARCVVFSDRAVIGGDEAVPEWLFTTLIRSTSVLVIVLWPDASPAARAVIGRLQGDRLLLWDSAARTAFHKAQALSGATTIP